MRLLLVEDDPTLRTQLKAAFEDAGCAVDGADTGLDALHLGETEPYDAVVLDLGLPVMDGLTVLSHWREAGRTMPVLILTARDRWHEKVAGIDAGADDYLTKPFHAEELMARMRALIRRAQGLASPVLRCGTIELDVRRGGPRPARHPHTGAPGAGQPAAPHGSRPRRAGAEVLAGCTGQPTRLRRRIGRTHRPRAARGRC